MSKLAMQLETITNPTDMQITALPDMITDVQEAKPETLESLKEAASVERVNVERALQSDSRITLKAALDKAQGSVKAYNKALVESLFAGFLQADDPMLAFMTLGFYKKLNLSTNEGKEGTTVTLDEKDAHLPLARFVAYAKDKALVRSALWQSKIQSVTALLSIRASQDIGVDVSQMLIDFDMDEQARGMVKKAVQPRAKNPISNNSLTDAMQDMLDDVFYSDNGKGHNQFRVVSATLHYFLYILFRRGSKPGSIATPRAATVENYLVEVCHMMVRGIDFSVEYKKLQTTEKAKAAA